MPTCKRPNSGVPSTGGSIKLRRGDLVFWDGHVGIMTSETDFLHANAFRMAVEAEPFARARKRIKDVGYEVTCVRRLPGPKPPRRKAR